MFSTQGGPCFTACLKPPEVPKPFDLSGAKIKQQLPKADNPCSNSSQKLNEIAPWSNQKSLENGQHPGV